MSTEPELAPRGWFGGAVAVWVAAAVFGVVIGLVAPAGMRALWLSVGLAGCLVLSFACQLWSGRTRRFVSRVAISMLGALVVLGIISAAFGLAALSSA